MRQYIHKVNYYETDKMGVTHHSNYIRWMEEARIDFLNQIGYGYKKLEEEGIISPVIKIECEYKAPTTFDDEIGITVQVEEFNGVKLVLKYTMINLKNDKIVLLGKSKHCFVDKNNKPLILKKFFPKLDNKLKDLTK